MSKYSLNYLRNNTLIGDVSVNGAPWTARALNLPDDALYTDTNADGDVWLFPGAVPVARVVDHFASFAVDSFPTGHIREYREGDKDREDVYVFQPKPGQPRLSVVVDQTRQMVADIKRDTAHFVPKSGYQIHDFRETLVERVARIVGESTGDLHIDSAGVLANGAEGWVSIATGSLLSTPEGVDYYPHLLASSSHNGTLASTIQAVNTMTVCDNTRAMALGEGRKNGTVTRTRHSKMSSARLERGEEEARAAMGLIVAASEEFASEIKRLCELPVTPKEWDAFLSVLSPLAEDAKPAAVTRVENFRETLTGLYNGDARVSQWNGTAFGALQAVSTFDLWERQAYGTTDHYARNTREAITGKIQEREQERHDALMRVLAV